MQQIVINEKGMHVIQHTQEEKQTFTIGARELDVIRGIVKQWLTCAIDERGIPYEAQKALDGAGTAPIDEDTYNRLALLAALVTSRMTRRRLLVLANRINKFSREECNYWLSKAQFGAYGNIGKRWAIAGMRMMLCGSGDEEETKTVYYQMQ